VHCSETIAELSQKLRGTFGFSENHIRAVLHDLRRVSQTVAITGGLSVVDDDPDDDKFIECAVVAGAEVIVSGDHHLLDLGEAEGVRVLSAAEFLSRCT